MNRFLHILGIVAVTAGGLATAGILPAIVLPIAGGVATLSAYFASNPVSLANAPQAALETAKVAKDVQAALTKGKPNFGK
jgi:hypothetical protein